MTVLDKILRSGKVEPFGAGSQAALDRLASAHGVRFSDDHQRFLLRCNGMRTAFDFEEVEAADLHMALADINTFYGVENGRGYADLAASIPGRDDNGQRLLAFAPSFAVGGDLCTYVEITAGARLGEVMYTDGEMYWSYFGDTDWTQPPDALIDQFVADGYFMPVAPSFGALLDMYARLV